MSGGHFDYINDRISYEMQGVWRDEEINELFNDLFCAPLWGDRTGGLATALDFWLSGDVGEDKYREYVNKFKDKWFRRTPKNRVDFYTDKLQEQCDRMKKELSGALVIEDDD